jgi:CoA:oxalate CoA-transferase
MESPQQSPLGGLRVLDLSRALSGPYAGRILSDLGADVVKVELPGADISNTFGTTDRPHAGLYVQLNAGKRNIAINLSDAKGAELFLDLAAQADIVIENFRPGTMDGYGLGWERLSSVNPRLILLSISGFGQDGPEANRRAYAPVVHAESGLLGRQADADGMPATDLMLGLSDSLAALHGSVAVLAALRLRDSTGQGSHLDISMLESSLSTDDYIHYSVEDNLPPWPARGQIFRIADDNVVIAADPRHLWNTLKKGVGLSDPDPQAPFDQKLTARARLCREWIEAFATLEELVPRLESLGLAWARVRDSRTVVDSPTIAARQVIAQVDDRAGGTRPVVKTPYRFQGVDGPRGGAAFVGEHDDEVLASWLGLDAAGIARLRTEGGLHLQEASAARE